MPTEKNRPQQLNLPSASGGSFASSTGAGATPTSSKSGSTPPAMTGMILDYLADEAAAAGTKDRRTSTTSAGGSHRVAFAPLAEYEAAHPELQRVESAKALLKQKHGVAFEVEEPEGGDHKKGKMRVQTPLKASKKGPSFDRSTAGTSGTGSGVGGSGSGGGGSGGGGGGRIFVSAPTISVRDTDTRSAPDDDRSAIGDSVSVAEERMEADLMGEGDGSVDDGTSSRGGSTTLDSMLTEDYRRKSKMHRFLRKVPFPVWVALALLIPVAMLVGSNANAFSEIAGQKSYLAEHKTIIALAAYCQDSLMIERGSSTIVLTWNTTAGFNTMHKTRLKTNERCLLVLDQALGSPDPAINGAYAVKLRERLQQLYAVRYRIDENYDITPQQERAFYTGVVDMMDEVWTIIAINPAMTLAARHLFELKLIQAASNQLGICRAVGAQIMGMNGTGVTEDLVTEFNLCGQRYKRNVRQLRAMMGGDTMFDTDEFKLLAAEMIRELRANPRQNLPWTTDYWFSTFSKAINVAGLTPEFEEEIYGQEVEHTVLIVLAIVLSTFAGVFVMWLQIDAMRRIQEAFSRTQMMQRQIAKFVPKSFLKLTGCTSILQVTVGSQTPVAVSMLFSDIRNFTGLSAGMTSETLFLWLEAYLRRMTTITEIHRGFVDKFIGDAIFSVYVSPADALNAGVDMQKETEQLNIDMKCNGGTDLLRIGVGIHHGVASAGFLGDDNRVTATLISKEVNIASRLEGLTKYYGCKILISSAAFDGLPIGAYRTRKIGTATVKGCADPVQLVEVFTSDDVEMQEYKIQTLATWEKAVKLREKNEIDESNKLFEECREIAANNGLSDGACDVKLSHTGTIDHWDEK